MKIVLWILSVFFVCLICSSAYAENIEISRQGELRVVSNPSEWIISEVTVTPGALVYGDAWKKAYRSEEIVPVEVSVAYTRNGWFHVTELRTVHKALVYDPSKRNIEVRLDPSATTKELFYPFLLPVFLCLLSLAVGNLFMIRHYTRGGIAEFLLLFAWIASCVSALVGFFPSCSFFACMAPFTGTVISFFAIGEGRLKDYQKSSMVLFLFMILTIIFYFTF